MRQYYALHQNDTYLRWRDRKLSGYPASIEMLRVHITNPARPTSAEIDALVARCREFGSALFCCDSPLSRPAAQLRDLGERLGLRRLDRNLCADDTGLTEVTVKPTDTDKSYIPYSNRPLSWHTDGYYNPPERQIRGWLLYCQQDAAEGGGNEIMDPDLAYIKIRDRDPELIRALTVDDVFTIPANRQGGTEIRADQTGPVFSFLRDGQLHMRYSARQRNVIWKSDELSQRASEALRDLFSTAGDLIFRHRMRPGEGLISNNALHRREGFRDDPNTGQKRLIYRARYYDRVHDT